MKIFQPVSNYVQKHPVFISVFAILSVCTMLLAANPTFLSFDATQFSTTGSGSAELLHISTGALLTNLSPASVGATTNNTPSTVVLRGVGGNLAFVRTMYVISIPTNIFTSTATYSGVINPGGLMPNNIMTSSAGGFDPTSTNYLGGALGIQWSITIGTSQYIIEKVIDSTHAYCRPPFVASFTSQTGQVSPPSFIYLDNTGTFEGGSRDGGGNASTPIWGNNGFELYNSNGTNCYIFHQGNAGNPFEANMLSLRSGWNSADGFNIAPSVNNNTLDLVSGARINFGGATVSHLTNFQSGGSIQVDTPFTVNKSLASGLKTAPTVVTVTASPFTYTCGAVNETETIAGGTMSSVVYAGTSLPAALLTTGIDLSLSPGQTIVITYTVAPAFVSKVF